MTDLIDRQTAVNALWNALYAYEDKTERQFIESEELDVGDWMEHQIFVQNMNDHDRQTILDLPSADAVEVVRCKDCKYYSHRESVCKLLSNNYEPPVVMYDDDYCSRGERNDV